MAFVQPKIDFSGSQELRGRLLHVQKNIRMNFLKRAARLASKPVIKLMRQNAPVETGTLKKSIGAKIKGYKGNMVVCAIIGPRSNYMVDGRRPVKYAHLVEGGTKPHMIGTLRLPSGRIVSQNFRHKGAKAKPFVRPSTSAFTDAFRIYERELNGLLRTYGA